MTKIKRLKPILFVSLVMILVFSLLPMIPDTTGVTNPIRASYVVTDYNFVIKPNLSDRTLTMECGVKVKALRDVEFINFYMDPVWNIKNIEGAREFEQDVDVITISKAMKRGSSEEFTFHYTTHLTGRNYPGRQWNYLNDDGMYLYQWWYPVTLHTIASGFSEIVTLKAEIKIPSDWIVCTSDVTKINEGGDKSFKVVELEARDPAFFYHLIAGPFKEKITEDPANVVSRVVFYGEEKYFEIGDVFSNEIFGALRYFEDKFGTPAPLEYSVIQMPDKFVTIMSDRAQMFIPGNILDSETDKLKNKDEGEKDDDEDDGYTSPKYLAEKVAACWWGGAIFSVGPEAKFLSTSLSAYSGLLYMVDLEGEKKLIEMLGDARDRYFDEVEVEDEVPLVSVADKKLLDVYFRGKGLIVHHMLRQVIGDAAFFKGLKNYASRFSGKFASIKDFESEMSRATGRSLSWFFDQWLLQSGRLTYEIDFTKLPGENPFRYKIRLEATGAMRMPFTIDVILADRSVHQFNWSANDLEMEKILESEIEPIGAKIHNPEGYMLTEFSKVNTLLEGSLKNFYYLDDFMIVEGTWQGNDELESKAHGRALFVQKMIKDKFDIEAPVVLDSEIDQDELKDMNLIMVGCTGCNALLAYNRIMPGVPFWSTNWTRKTGPMFPGADLPEGTVVFPNPMNPWRGIIQDEFFNSKGNFKTIDMIEDFYYQALETGSVMKGFLHKRGKEYWTAPEPLIVDLNEFNSNKIETTGNVVTFEGTSNTEFYITYNTKNPIIFGEPVMRIFVPKGEFEIEIELLRGEEFSDDHLIIDASDDNIVLQKHMTNDFRGELEPPIVTIADFKSSYSYGEAIIVEWEGRDNSAFYKDIEYSWSIDGEPRTSFKAGTKTTIENLPEGKHTFKLWARDVRGNLNYSIPQVSFIVK
jgi:Peptidase family M1 domain